MLAVDVRTGGEDAGRRETIRRNHAAQLDELLFPLAGIPEARHPVAELAERELRVVLDMKVQIDQAGDDRATRQIEDFRVRRQRQRRADLRDAVSLDYDTPVFNRRGPGAVDHTDVVQHQCPDLTVCREHQHRAEGCHIREPSTCVAHGDRLSSPGVEGMKDFQHHSRLPPPPIVALRQE